MTFGHAPRRWGNRDRVFYKNVRESHGESLTLFAGR
jgi:hypothetical protein